MPKDPTKKSEPVELVEEFKHSRALTSCCWDPLDRSIFFGAEDNQIHRYDLKTKTLTSLAAHDSWVRAIGITSDGEELITGGYDGRLIWWPAAAEAPTPLRSLEAHAGWIRALAIHPSGSLIATCGNDKLVKLWNRDSGELVAEKKGHESHVYNVAFTPDGESLVSCDHKGVVKVWGITDDGNARDLLRIEALHKYDDTFRADIGGARSIAFRPDGSELALGGITNVTNAFAGIGEIAVAIVDWQQASLRILLQSEQKVRGAAWGIAYHPQGHWVGLAGGGGGGFFYLWKGDSVQEFYNLKLKSDGRGMSMSPDFQRVAVAHADQHLRIYRLLG